MLYPDSISHKLHFEDVKSFLAKIIIEKFHEERNAIFKHADYAIKRLRLISPHGRKLYIIIITKEGI